MSPKIYLIYGKYTILGIAAWSLSYAQRYASNLWIKCLNIFYISDK